MTKKQIDRAIKRGKVVVLGIRPEDVYEVDAPAEGRNLSAPVDVEVNVFELLGASAMIYGELEGSSISASVGADTEARPGATVQLKLDLDKLHLFDKETEQAIVH